MTVCIAYECYDPVSIVVASDRKATMGDLPGAADVGKTNYVIPHWRALVAGNDTSQHSLVLKRVGPKTLGAIMSHLTSTSTSNVSREELQRAFAKAYQEQLQESAADGILGCWGLDIAEFRRVGLTQFGEAEFTRIASAIENFKFGFRFLVYGFFDVWSHLFVVSNPGVINPLAGLKFWAIGSGAAVALGSFVSLKNQPSKLAEVVYRVCEAKFAAEAVRGVGPETDVMILYPNDDEFVLSDNKINEIKAKWQTNRQHQIPTDALEATETAIEEALTTEEIGKEVLASGQFDMPKRKSERVASATNATANREAE